VSVNLASVWGCRGECFEAQEHCTPKDGMAPAAGAKAQPIDKGDGRGRSWPIAAQLRSDFFRTPHMQYTRPELLNSPIPPGDLYL
jgi:hypothetical protein